MAFVHAWCIKTVCVFCPDGTNDREFLPQTRTSYSVCSELEQDTRCQTDSMPTSNMFVV